MSFRRGGSLIVVKQSRLFPSAGGVVTDCYRRLRIAHRPVRQGLYCAAIPSGAAAMLDTTSTATHWNPESFVETAAQPSIDGPLALETLLRDLPLQRRRLQPRQTLF